MSFILQECKFDKAKKLYPIARVKTKEKLQYLYYIQDKLDKIDDKFLEGLSQEDKDTINQAIQDKEEPEDERVQKIYYDVLHKMKHKKKRFVAPKGKKLEVLPNYNIIEKLYIAGQSGSGKSYFASNWIKNYLQHYPNNEFFLLSAVEEDEILDRLEPVRVDLDNLLQDPIDVKEEMVDSVVLIDDCASITNVNIRKYVINLVNQIAQLGRHYKTTLLNVVHNILDHHNSKTILVEATSVVIFCKNNNKQNIDYLERYCNFDKEQITKVLNVPSRWICISKMYPNIILHERGAYIP